MLRAFKYRLLPNDVQQVLLEKHFGCSRFVYNHFLCYRKRAWVDEKRSVTFFKSCTLLSELKRSPDHVWLTEVNSQALQASLKNLDSAYQRFFKTKKGYPNFKHKDSKQSFTCPQFVITEGNLVFLPKFKSGIKFVQHRKLPDVKIKQATISKTPTGKYFISFLVDDNIVCPNKLPTDPETAIGIDLGIKDFATLSTGEKISNPKHFKKYQKKLKKAQRKLSRKKKDSNNRKKQKKRVAVIHEKIANSRRDFHHKLSSKLIRENQTICLETLRVQELQEKSSKTMSRNIGDAGWSEFGIMLEYKSNMHGRNIKRVGTFVATSKMCTCGTKNDKLTLGDRVWTCHSCGTTHDRDVLAAQNIKTFSLDPARYLTLTSTVGTTGIHACGDVGTSLVNEARKVCEIIESCRAL